MKISSKIFRALAFGCAILLLANSSFAQSRVVVIPMSGDDLKPLHNIITVAKENGDFTDPVAAMASISDAAEDNPYLLVIAPGDYTLTSPLVMQSYVDIAGSGRNVTRLIADNFAGSTSQQRSLVVAADHAYLKDLSLIGIDGSARIGIYSSGDVNNGLQVFSNLSITITTSAANIAGVYNLESSQTIIRDTIINVNAVGSNIVWGIFSSGVLATTLEGVTITASSARRLGAYGVYIAPDSPVTIYNSKIQAELPVSVLRTNPPSGEMSYILGTFLYPRSSSPAVAAPAQCSFVFNGNGGAYDADCNYIDPAP